MHIIAFQTNQAIFHKILTIWENVRWNFITSLTVLGGFVLSVSWCPLRTATCCLLRDVIFLRFFHYLWHEMFSFSEKSHYTILKEIQLKKEKKNKPHVNFLNPLEGFADEKYHKWAWLCNFKSMGEETIQLSAKSVSKFLDFVILFHIWYRVNVKNKMKIGPINNWCSGLFWVE